jgi:hypothetical protein
MPVIIIMGPITAIICISIFVEKRDTRILRIDRVRLTEQQILAQPKMAPYCPSWGI